MIDRARGSASLLLAVLGLTACVSGRAPMAPATADPGAARREAPPAPTADSTPPAESAASLRRALEGALAGASRESLRLWVECRRDAGMTALEIHGRGIAIRDGERQLRLEPEGIDAVLGGLVAADFPGLSERYGGRVPKDDDMAILVTCRISLSLAGLAKEVTQLAEGEQSATLRKLAGDLFAIAEANAGPATTASSLRDGLEKIARGELEPECWSVTLHRAPDAPPAGAEAGGFLFAISGREASVRLLDPGSGGYAPPRTLELAPDDIRRAARALAALDPSAWPVNLYSSDYIDLSLSVLNRRQSVQARQFAGMTPTSRGESQLAFEAAVDLLVDVEREVVARSGTKPN